LSSAEFNSLGRRLESALSLSKPIVAVTFKPDVTRLRRSTDVVESSCVFWTKALDDAFYTTPDQHQHCSVGAVTHGYRLAKDTLPGKGLADIDLLTSVGWIGKDDILGLPSLPLEAQRNIGYAPLDKAPFVPNVVGLGCTASRTRSGYPESEIVVTLNARNLKTFVERLERIAAVDAKVKAALTHTT
jgi:uncharacterized protein (DUF169 family)